MAIKEPDKNLYWYNASLLTIEGKGWSDTEEIYDRLPKKAKSVVREPVWNLSKQSSGISIHFTSNTPSLAIRWDGFNAMNHMAATGVSGVDLYVRYQDKWKWLAVGRPSKPLNETQFFTDIGSEPREYMLYLPLYNPIHRVELGLPDPYTITPTLPRDKKPIVFYGTSITQGGCATRPGMSYTAILGRWLDHPVINLGFSGNGIMEPEVIDLLCELDPVLYVLDNLPNMNQEAIQARSESGFRKLLNARPSTPIVLIDNIFYCDAYLVPSRMERYTTCNELQFQIYQKLKAEGYEKLIYIKDNHLIGNDGEATVDGVHMTDLGYMRFSENLIEPLRSAILGNK